MNSGKREAHVTRMKTYRARSKPQRVVTRGAHTTTQGKNQPKESLSCSSIVPRSQYCCIIQIEIIFLNKFSNMITKISLQIFGSMCIDLIFWYPFHTFFSGSLEEGRLSYFIWANLGPLLFSIPVCSMFFRE